MRWSHDHDETIWSDVKNNADCSMDTLCPRWRMQCIYLLPLLVVSRYYYNCFTALCPGLPGWAGTRRNTHPFTYPDCHPTLIRFFHLLQSIASSLLNLRAWQSFYTTCLQVLFALPLGLEPSTSYSIHFFTQSLSSFRNTCPYHHSLFCCSTKVISSIPRLSLSTLYLGLYL